MFRFHQLVLVLLIIYCQCAPQKCGLHMVDPNQQYSWLEANSTAHNGDRRLQTERETTWSSIRIKVEILNDDLSSSLKNYIENQVIDGAIEWYSNVLNVRRFISKIQLTESAMTNCVPPLGTGLSIPSNYQTEGVEADYVFFVAVISDINSSYVGFASPCVLDPITNQPVAGYFVINYVEEWNMSYEDYLSTTIHEMCHAFGFTPGMFQYYLKANGQVYGTSELMFNKEERGVSVTKIKSPNVLAHARAAFNCPTLDGVELESSGGSGTIGSHWDKRIMNDEFMVADAVVNDIVYSDITMALLEDSGWYGVNYQYTMPIEWGYKKGCNFLTTQCIIDGVVQFDVFCNVVESEKCDYKHLNKGQCRIGTWNGALPSAYQYFDNPEAGGEDRFLDYCPIVYQNTGGNCRGLEVGEADLNSDYGEKVCENCRCIEGTYSKKYEPHEHAGCHWVECKASSAIIHIGDSQVECPFTGGDVEVPGYNGVVHCPPSNILCDPKPCMNNCSGIGMCVKGVCECPDGTSGGDCGDIKKDFSYSLPPENADEGTWSSVDDSSDGSPSTPVLEEDEGSMYLGLIWSLVALILC